MAERNIPVMMMDGKEYMMTPDESKAYFNGLERTDQAAGIFPLGRYNQLLKSSPKAAAKLKNWYNGLSKNKWGTKIFDGVSNTHVPAVVPKITQAGAKVPAVANNAVNSGIKLSNKAKAQLGAFGVAGTAGMGYGALSKEEAAALAAVDQDDAELLSGLKSIQDGKKVFPYPMVPGSRGKYSDQVGNLQATPYQNALAFDIDKTAAYRDGGIGLSDDEIISGIMAQHNAENNINTAAKNELNNMVVDPKMSAAIKSVDKPTAVTNVKRTISSDPGYTDGYRIDGEAPAPQPVRRAATVDPLNLFGNKNGYNPFSNSERAAAGQAPISFSDFFKSQVGTKVAAAPKRKISKAESAAALRQLAGIDVSAF